MLYSSSSSRKSRKMRERRKWRRRLGGERRRTGLRNLSHQHHADVVHSICFHSSEALEKVTG
jgi:hypothetical protein